MQRKRARRAIIWDLLYYGFCLFAIFYLIDKNEIKNWDTIFVFIPLIFLGCSTETLSKTNCKGNFLLSPYCYIDFCTKVISYIVAQIMFRRIVRDIYLEICCSVIVGLMIVSVVCAVFMIKRSKK